MSFNLAATLLDRNRKDKRRTAILCDSGQLTYQELRTRVEATAYWLQQQGLKPEQRVALILYDSPELIIAFLAVVRAGGVAVPLNPWSQQDHAFYLQDSRAVLAIVEPESKHLSGVKDCKLFTPGDFSKIQPEETNPLEITTVEDDAAFWLYSSGSTGRPKAVVHCQKDLIVSCETYAWEILQIQPEDILFSTAKIFFAYGLGNSLAFPIYFGASTVVDR